MYVLKMSPDKDLKLFIKLNGESEMYIYFDLALSVEGTHNSNPDAVCVINTELPWRK